MSFSKTTSNARATWFKGWYASVQYNHRGERWRVEEEGTSATFSEQLCALSEGGAAPAFLRFGEQLWLQMCRGVARPFGLGTGSTIGWP